MTFTHYPGILMRVFLVVSALLLAALPPLTAQDAGGCWRSHAAPDTTEPGRRTAHAVRAGGAAPVVDGRLDDDAWCRAPVINTLIQSTPDPGAASTLRTEARVLYDDEAVYIAVRLGDPHPDSIVAPYPRRDDENLSDWVFVEMDTRHDRRSGFSFGLNPRGVQVDGTWSNDVDYDAAWNGVWQGASAIDAEGWTAEFRIPFSQVALAAARAGAPLTWGLNIYRYSPHRGESSNWSPRLPRVVGVVSHFNALEGIAMPPASDRVELLPYASVSGERQVGDDRDHAATGMEVRYRPSASSSVQLSLHPDFGQVEADPSQVNLTTFETFLPEQRPLFVASSQLLQFGTPLAFAARGTTFEQESPFYTRRVGRASPAGCPPAAGHCVMPSGGTVLGALRASARTANGWSASLFDAWTGREQARFTVAGGAEQRQLVDPLTHLAAARLNREFGDGRAALGVMGTYTGRYALADGLDSLVSGNAQWLGIDGRVRSRNDAWEVRGSLSGSRVGGSPDYIARLRREPMHGYARPDSLSELPADTVTRHALSGLAASLQLDRTTGSLQGGIAGRLVSRGFETNDLGFQRNADWLLAFVHWRYLVYHPGRLVRRWSVGSEELGAGWTLGGLRRAAVASLDTKADFRNYWGTSLRWDHEFTASDPEVLRGGPALRLPPRDRVSLSVYTDTRKRWQATLASSVEMAPATDALELDVSPDFSAFVTDRLQLGLTPEVATRRDGWQYVAGATGNDGRPHYALGELHQTTVSLTTRATYAFSSHLTLQLYSQAFLSSGEYRALREVVAPAADHAADRVAPIAPDRVTSDTTGSAYTIDAGPGGWTFDNPDFSSRELHLNLLLRWEFRPGSTLYLVWTHVQRDATPAPFGLSDDLHRLWRAPAANALQAKVSYWIGI